MVKHYPEGRICKYKSCDTILSIYNPTAFCAIHERTMPEGETKKERKPRILPSK